MQRAEQALDQARKLLAEIQHWSNECVRLVDDKDERVWENAHSNLKIAAERFASMAPRLLTVIVEGK
jgi:hypothetical protein